jgi:hypothetical protein
LSSNLDKDNVLNMSKMEFNDYCGFTQYHADLGDGLNPSTKSTSTLIQTGELTAFEFWRGIKRDKTLYEKLKDGKHHNTWNRGFVSTAFIHHTQFVLDGDYVPVTPTEVGLFREMQIFMYAVLEEKLNTDKGRSLVSAYKSKPDAHSIYKDLTKHDKRSTSAQLSGDILLKYITSARYPGNWCGTSYAFVLHWKEQVMQYKKLE